MPAATARFVANEAHLPIRLLIVDAGPGRAGPIAVVIQYPEIEYDGGLYALPKAARALTTKIGAVVLDVITSRQSSAHVGPAQTGPKRSRVPILAFSYRRHVERIGLRELTPCIPTQVPDGLAAKRPFRVLGDYMARLESAHPRSARAAVARSADGSIIVFEAWRSE